MNIVFGVFWQNKQRVSFKENAEAPEWISRHQNERNHLDSY